MNFGVFMNLYKKNIIVTGGTSGIGLELVRILAKNNKVIVISKRGDLPDDLINSQYSIQLYHTDLAKKAEIESVVDQIQKKYSLIDVLINNAAIQNTPEFLSDDFNYDLIQTEIDVNFTAVCHLTYLVLPMLLQAKRGNIININTGLAIAPKQSSAIYCATKSALDSLSKSLSYQLEDTNVDVSQVFLPLVDTPMTFGRGENKLRAEDVASYIVQGTKDIGKVKLLRLINYLVPSLAQRIMRSR